MDATTNLAFLSNESRGTFSQGEARDRVFDLVFKDSASKWPHVSITVYGATHSLPAEIC